MQVMSMSLWKMRWVAWTRFAMVWLVAGALSMSPDRVSQAGEVIRMEATIDKREASSRRIEQSAKIIVNDGSVSGDRGMTWLCSPKKLDDGICDTSPVFSTLGRRFSSEIRVKLTEQTSRVKHEVIVSAHAENRAGDDGIAFTTAGKLNNPRAPQWDDRPVSGRLVEFRLDNLTFGPLAGGVWKGFISLFARGPDGVTPRPDRDILLALTLTVIDSENAQVFFTDEKSTAISAGIPLRRLANSDLFAGLRVVPLCLYDGFGMSANQYQLSVTSSNAQGNNRFLHHATNSDVAAGKLRYRVNLATRGGAKDIGAAAIVLNRSDLQFRTVIMPGVAGHAVYCGSASLAFTVNAFDPRRQLPGSYSDDLKLIFSRSSSAL